MKPIIEPIFQEWWRVGRIVATAQQKEDIKLAFYVGWYASQGLTAKLMVMDTDKAMKMGKQMQEECRKVLYDRTAMPKFTASIDGKLISNH
jgi:hypothetical protein